VSYGLMALMLFGVPLLLAAFFGLFAFTRLSPLVYECRCCEHQFHGAPHRPFPELCPRCGARDWNTGGGADSTGGEGG
jgi:hypothetical protein